MRMVVPPDNSIGWSGKWAGEINRARRASGPNGPIPTIAFPPPRLCECRNRSASTLAGELAAGLAANVKSTRLAPFPLLLAVDRLFDAGGGARIFPPHFAKGGAGGLLLL